MSGILIQARDIKAFADFLPGFSPIAGSEQATAHFAREERVVGGEIGR